MGNPPVHQTPMSRATYHEKAGGVNLMRTMHHQSERYGAFASQMPNDLGTFQVLRRVRIMMQVMQIPHQKGFGHSAPTRLPSPSLPAGA